MNVETVSGRLAAQAKTALRGDPDPSASLVPPESSGALVPAAVLVPLVDHPGEMTVLLTRRTQHLAHHPGQISFPGGRLDPEDEGDPVVCALRETAEEVGLDSDRIRVLGQLDQYVTGTGFLITPVVGLVRPPFTVIPDPFEVADVFEVPLSFILDRANHQHHVRVVGGQSRSFWALSWGDFLIWGATAGILVNLSEVLADAEG
ncbi:NUDIX hydrolase [Magnetospirillum molischianum]|uniref:NUDIX hydrolase n=1 Tax=Magnetospirillum molischianum TaxID=1083 RepID=UPI0002D3B302|nr:CoA pyrophosphatase [Magnetospirillum molischianum]